MNILVDLGRSGFRVTNGEKANYFRRLLSISGVLGSSLVRLGKIGPAKVIGEKRTGPALNPLKGSSARLPHPAQRCNLPAILIPLFSTNSMLFPGKKALLPPKNYLPETALPQLVGQTPER